MTLRRVYLIARCFGSYPLSKEAHFPSPVSTRITRFVHCPYQQLYCHCHSLACSDHPKNKNEIETLHAKAIKDGFFQHLYVSNHLLSLYVKSQNLFWQAHKLFDDILDKDVRSWTILISGFARNGYRITVWDLFRRMQNHGVCPNPFTLSTVLKFCSSIRELRIGKAIHGWIVINGVALDTALRNSVLDLYAKCGAFHHAKRLFDKMEGKDAVSWNIMISGYLQSGDVEGSLDMFRSFRLKNVVSWNTIIDGLMRNGLERNALELLYGMVRNGPVFNAVTFSIALNLVSCLLDLRLGKEIHSQVLKLVIDNDGFVRNSLLDMYCKCGKMEEAYLVFKKMPLDSSCKNPRAEIFSRSLIVSGYVHNGEHALALKTFSSIIHEHIVADAFTLTSIVSACANIGILAIGRQIHAYILKIGHKVDAHLSSSLIDMYAKSGSLIDAQKFFKQTNDFNVVPCTSMIFGYGLHGQGREAIQLFERMMNGKIKPNEITFIGVLTACSHAGLLEEGCKYFELMQKNCGIKPGVEHYTCMVDLFGRAGCLKEIKDFIHENGISHLSVIWKSFLSSCRLHKNAEMGKWVSERLLQLKPFDAGSYILASNLFATCQSWQEAANVRILMERRRVKRFSGQSWIQLKNRVHSFVMGDRSHHQESEIYSYLEKLIGRLKEIGYSSDVKVVMQDVEEEQGEILLGFHSEKLAVAYGIISTTSGTPIHIMKNLTICIDCHNFIKYTSQLLDREIIVRDPRRFHHFKHGHCSCGDYW